MFLNTRTIRFLSGLGAALIFSVSLAGCRLLGNAEGSSAMTGGTSAGDTNGGESAAGSGDGSGTTASAAPVEVTYGTEDTSAAYDAASATAIVFSGSTMSIQGSGASAKGSVLTISAAGTYILSGTLTAGQVVVDAGKEDTVRLILNGVSITCANSAPLYAKKAAKTILTLADGTQNALTDGASYTFPDAETDEPSAAVFSKNDLTINGGGTLTVTGQYNNGIASKDVLTITFHGKSAHGGIEPEKGINAINAAALAISKVKFGRIDPETTSNIGRIEGGAATNIVTDKVTFTCEVRSHSQAQIEAQVQKIMDACQEAAAEFGATVDIDVDHFCPPHKPDLDGFLTKATVRALELEGITPEYHISNGSGDSNIFSGHGFDCSGISTGMFNVHTTDEYLDLAVFEQAFNVTWRIVTEPLD